jgi:hypothetical protein
MRSNVYRLALATDTSLGRRPEFRNRLWVLFVTSWPTLRGFVAVQPALVLFLL